MAVIHHTRLKPTKLELLASWLPSRPWYRDSAGGPKLANAGGFRLDDPQGEVGIEFIVVTDASGPGPTAYLVPLTYRGAPLDRAEHALVGTMEHGVLGRRWVYDGCHDPVLIDQLPALIEGRAQAQDQNTTGVPARDVTCAYAGEGPIPMSLATAATETQESTELPTLNGASLRLHRALRPAPDASPLSPGGTTGHVAGSWHMPDGSRAVGLFATLHTGPRS
ncbi:1,4-alpha-glucan branching protein [Streptomyces sp. NPDC015125]|uniref:maltokinase N-terminal cap-like domain-containing protein n=1 Tax=Streptomyces sp. NPDC015125 TaxID=3364938 RepID=UPI0036FCA638